MNPNYFTQKELAKFLGCTEKTIINHREKGLINFFQFSVKGKIFIDKAKFFEEDLPKLKQVKKRKAL